MKDKFNNVNARVTLALDGPAASGKGMIGKKLAEIFNLEYFQSGIIYRQLAYHCIKNSLSPDKTFDVIALSHDKNIIDILQEDLNTEEIASVASVISVIPEVRQNLTGHLIRVINSTPRIIMEGRDIGTIVAPNADFKIYITADVNIRAERRYKQLILENKKCILGDILKQLIKRDQRDENRLTSPLKPASDAFILDTSYLTPDSVIQKIKDEIFKI